jgi:hypothetical protein
MVAISCSGSFYSKYDWLIGTWEYEEDNRYLQESWSWNQNKKQFNSKGFFLVHGSDTMYHQNITFSEVDDLGYLNVLTKNQNQEKEAYFTLQSATGDSLVFINNFPDFPKYIMYRKIDDNIIETSALGIKNGKQVIERFRLYRKTE